MYNANADHSALRDCMTLLLNTELQKTDFVEEKKRKEERIKLKKQ